MYKIHGYKDKKDKNEKKEGLNEFRVIRINLVIVRTNGNTWCENMLQAWYIVTYSYQQALRTYKNKRPNLSTCCDPVQTASKRQTLDRGFKDCSLAMC